MKTRIIDRLCIFSGALALALTLLCMSLVMTSCGGGASGGAGGASIPADEYTTHNPGGWGGNGWDAGGSGGSEGGSSGGSTSGITVQGGTSLNITGYTYNGITYSDVTSLTRALRNANAEGQFYVSFTVAGESTPRQARVTKTSDGYRIEHQYKATYYINDANGTPVPTVIFYYIADGINLSAHTGADVQGWQCSNGTMFNTGIISGVSGDITLIQILRNVGFDISVSQPNSAVPIGSGYTYRLKHLTEGFTFTATESPSSPFPEGAVFEWSVNGNPVPGEQGQSFTVIPSSIGLDDTNIGLSQGNVTVVTVVCNVKKNGNLIGTVTKPIMVYKPNPAFTAYVRTDMDPTASYETDTARIDFEELPGVAAATGDIGTLIVTPLSQQGSIFTETQSSIAVGCTSYTVTVTVNGTDIPLTFSSSDTTAKAIDNVPAGATLSASAQIGVEQRGGSGTLDYTSLNAVCDNCTIQANTSAVTMWTQYPLECVVQSAFAMNAFVNGFQTYDSHYTTQGTTVLPTATASYTNWGMGTTMRFMGWALTNDGTPVISSTTTTIPDTYIGKLKLYANYSDLSVEITGVSGTPILIAGNAQYGTVDLTAVPHEFPAGEISYSWRVVPPNDPNPVVACIEGDSTNATATVKALSDVYGYATIEVTVTCNGLSASKTQIVSVPGIEITGDSIVKRGDSIQLSATKIAFPQNESSRTWNHNGDHSKITIDQGSMPTTFSPSATAATGPVTVTLQMVLGGDKIITAQKDITIVDFTISGVDYVQRGGSVNLTASINGISETPTNCTWSSNGTNTNVTATGNGMTATFATNADTAYGSVTVTLTGTVSGKTITATKDITVAGISIVGPDSFEYDGTSTTQQYSVSALGGVTLANITFSELNDTENVAEISQTGATATVTAVKGGTYTIKATARVSGTTITLEATNTITITRPAMTLSCNNSEISKPSTLLASLNITQDSDGTAVLPATAQLTVGGSTNYTFETSPSGRITVSNTGVASIADGYIPSPAGETVTITAIDNVDSSYYKSINITIRSQYVCAVYRNKSMCDTETSPYWTKILSGSSSVALSDRASSMQTDYGGTISAWKQTSPTEQQLAKDATVTVSGDTKIYAGWAPAVSPSSITLYRFSGNDTNLSAQVTRADGTYYYVTPNAGFTYDGSNPATITVDETKDFGTTNGVYTGSKVFVYVPGEPESFVEIPITVKDCIYVDGSGTLKKNSGIPTITIPENYTIPTSVGGRTVTEVGSYVFEENNTIKTLIIPDGMKIGEWSFYKCTELTTLTIGNNVEFTGDRSFWECSKLETISVGTGVIFGASFIFEDTAVKNFTFPNGISEVPRGIFEGCTQLNQITIPSGVTKICYRAFYGATFGTLVIPTSVTEIEYFAFIGATGTINYAGTINDWKAVTRGQAQGGVSNSNNVTVHCTDGDCPYWEGMTVY